MPQLIKVPPPDLRSRVSETDRVEEYLQVGVRTASAILNFLGRSGYDLSQAKRILDFACGCGRTLNFLGGRLPDCQIHGCDYDADLVDWCRRNLPSMSILTNPAMPPTELPDSAFDLIYSISFFTHIDEAAQMAWLEEWRRILKKDGLLLLSLHGPLLAQRNGVRIPSHGFWHKRSRGGFNQQVTFQTRAYAESRWKPIFQIAAYDELGLLHHQDLALLTPAGSSRRAATAQRLEIPRQLAEHYRRRPDLQEVFDQRGLGKPESMWCNLSLLDWAMFDGCKESEELRHLGFGSLFEVIEAS